MEHNHQHEHDHDEEVELTLDTKVCHCEDIKGIIRKAEEIAANILKGDGCVIHDLAVAMTVGQLMVNVVEFAEVSQHGPLGRLKAEVVAGGLSSLLQKMMQNDAINAHFSERVRKLATVEEGQAEVQPIHITIQ